MEIWTGCSLSMTFLSQGVNELKIEKSLLKIGTDF